MQWKGATRYPEEPIVVHGRAEVTRLLIHAVAIGASDVIFQSGRPVLASVHGRLCALTKTWLQPTTLARIATELTTTESIMSKLYSGQDFDRAITVQAQHAGDRHAEAIGHRFRINVTAGYYEGDVGVQIVCRHIPAEPPDRRAERDRAGDRRRVDPSAGRRHHRGRDRLGQDDDARRP